MFLVSTHYKNIRKQKSLFLAIVILLSLYSTCLMGEWSTPPLVIYPPSSPFDATNSFIATDAQGNSVAVWIDTTETGSMQAATLASGAINEQGQPSWILIHPVSPSHVLDPANTYAQAIGMDSTGNAIATWTDGTFVYTSTLSPGETNWSTPVTINTQIGSQLVANLYIAVASNGNAVVTWTSSIHPYDCTVLASVFDFESQTWSEQKKLLNSAVEFDLSVNPVAIDPRGNALVVVTQTSNNVQAISYNVDSHTWVEIPSIATTSLVYTYSSMDSSGNASIVWLEQNNTMNAATLLFNTDSLINQNTLSIEASLTTTFPIVTSDTEGNAVAIWANISGGLASSRYSFAKQTWTNLPLLDLEGSIPSLISIAGDTDGNVAASWTVFLDTTSYIQTASLLAGNSSWTSLRKISPISDLDNNSHVIITTTGNAIILWENDINDDTTGTINSSIYLNIFAPTPPLNFTGKVVKNKFLTQIDRIHKLQWEASLDHSVIKYCLYRNSNLIHITPSGKSSFSYEDHNRNSSVRDTYMLVSVKADDSESSPVFVTLK